MADNGHSRNNGARTGRGNPPAEHQFKPGNPAGRPKGARNKLGEAFLADLYDDWLQNGVDAIQRVCRDRPQDYLKIIASILPRDLNVRVNEFEDWSDEEIEARLRTLASDPAIRDIIADCLDGIGPGDKVN